MIREVHARTPGHRRPRRGPLAGPEHRCRCPARAGHGGGGRDLHPHHGGRGEGRPPARPVGREPEFLARAAARRGRAGGVAAAGGGTRCPLALLSFLPVAFAALSYPLTSVVFIGAVDVLTLVGVGAIATKATPDPVHLGFFATCLGMTTVICAWEAFDHDRQREDLARISRADPLTGCLNRRGFEERLDAEIDSGMRTGRRTALVVLDLDHFKDVNDTRGHEAGDSLLRWVVETINRVLRPMDSLGR